MRNRHLQDYETVWQDVLLATGQPDRDWSWDYKLRRGERNASDEAYAIEVDNLTQGLMLIETQRHRSHRRRFITVIRCPSMMLTRKKKTWYTSNTA
jgi:hypothetical protein